jgi:omega-amidase
MTELSVSLAQIKVVHLPHWKVLVRARAIENQVGSEDFGPGGIATYFGNSVIIGPWGETIIEAGETEEELLTATIDIDAVDRVRSKMRVLQDRRPELYEL